MDPTIFKEIDDCLFDPSHQWHSHDEDKEENFCKYGHYEEFNKFLPECINEILIPVEQECGS